MAGKAPAPGEQIRALDAALARGLPRAVILRGEERWYRERAIARIVAAAEAAGLEVVRHDARDPDLDLRALLGHLSEAPMFSSGRCIVVRSAGGLLRKAPDTEREPPLVEPLLAWLASRSPAGCVVLDAEGLRADSTVVRRAEAAGAPVLEMRRLYDSVPAWDPGGDPRQIELVRWVEWRARERSIPLSSDEALYVATATGNDLAALDDALTRLDGRGRESVRGLVAWESGASPWDVADQVLSGDAARAVAGLEALFRGGFARGGERELDRDAIQAMLYAGLRNRARQAWAGAQAAESGGDALVASGYKGPPGGRGAVQALIRRRSAQEWERLVEDLAALERRTRLSKDQGGADTDVADLVAFALRWRMRARTPPARGGRTPPLE